MELIKGKQFDSIVDVKNAVRAEAIASFTEIKVIKSDKSRYRVKCTQEDCSWHLYASLIGYGPRCEIRDVGEHTCGGVQQLGNKEASASWLARRYYEKLREHPHYKPAELIDDFRREAGVTITYNVAYRAKETAMNIINGDHKRAYRKLPAFCQKLLETNPGSKTIVEAVGGRFYRVFIAYGACLTGFASCRPFLGLDATFLTGKYLGHLICATGIDATGGLYPVAFGVIDNENTENWTWFLMHLRDCLEVHPTLTFVSDRDKGLQEALFAVFPNNANAYCMRHLEANLKKKCNNTEFLHFFWEAARANTIAEYDEQVCNMRGVNNDATDWLMQAAPSSTWATAYFSGQRFGHLTSNIAESLNSLLLDAREKPIIAMLIDIRHALMDRFHRRGNEARREWDNAGQNAYLRLVPEEEKRIAEAVNRARQYRILPSNGIVFEVITPEHRRVVDLENQTCTCCSWQHRGIPCAHAIGAILWLRRKPQEFANPGYSLKSWCDAYEGAIFPFEDVLEEEEVDMKPPATRKPPGRPKKKRIRTEDRFRELRPFRCSRCGQYARHNRKSCRNSIAE